MGRYRGATCRIARRFGSDLGLKSRLRDLASKCKLTAPPGVHGQKRARLTDYGRQLQAKQKIKFTYGVSENQFRRYFKLASTQKGATGENLLKLLECRLDNVVYRLGFASTRAEARQLVRHKAMLVNERVVSIPSYLVKPNDVIEVREKSKQQTRVLDALRLAENAGFPDWVTVEVSKIVGTFRRIPDRDELSAELEEQLVVELYSK